MMRIARLFILGILALIGLAGCGSMSLAADVTPPPNLTPVTPNTPANTGSMEYPLLPPDPALGQQIYAEKCLPCHGENGMGDGFQAGNLPAPPPAIGSSDLARAARPSDWFAIVTEGRIDKLMPGFGESLSDRQRWDVVAYVFSLSVDPGDIALGEDLYAQKCASCHGEQGEGNGQDVPDWTQQERLAILSDNEIEAVLAQGKNAMPAFANELSEAERFALAAYIRSLTYAGAGMQGAQAVEPTAPSPEATPGEGANPDAVLTPGAPRTLTVQGSIQHASGGNIVAELPVKLLGFEGMTQVMESGVTSGADGSFAFADVEVKTGMVFIVQVEQAGYTFNSDIIHPADITGDRIDVPITVYDTTTDLNGVVIDRLHVFFDFSVPGKVQVVELFILSNPTNQVIVPASASQPVLGFKLPDGFTNLQFDAGSLGDRFISTPDGFGDLAPIPPNPEQHQILFSYDLPYERRLGVELALPLDVNAVVVMLPPGGVELRSDQLMAAGSRDVQGMTFQLFTGSGLSGGDSIKVELSGRSASSGPSATSNITGLLIGLGVFGVVLVGAGVWLIRQRKLQEEDTGEVEDDAAPEDEESLLDAILALDDLYQAGKLPEEAYTQRRSELKERLRKLNEG